jgi:hypothetical protein
MVRPTAGAPIEVIASINGNSWNFIIESYGDDRAFGNRSFSISGRSPSSALAAPYSNPVSYSEDTSSSAAAIAADILSLTPYTSNFLLTDWIIPANAYSVQNKTPMQQLLTIANAAGGVVHSSMDTDIISLVPRYTFAPWAWGTETVEAALPTWASRRTRYQSLPQYNGVYVSGQNQGVSVQVKRNGTDGSSQPQMVTDALVTATEAGLQLGTKILSDSGIRSIEAIEAPLLDDPGLLTPGMFIEVYDPAGNWKGQVIRTRINAQRPTVTQSLSILRYLGT